MDYWPVESRSVPRVLLLLHQLSRTGAPLLALRLFQALGDHVDLRSVAWEGGPLKRQFRALGEMTVLASYPASMPGPSVAHERVLLGKALGRVRAPIEGLRIRRWQPDLVYANSVWSLPLVRSLGLANRPILLHVHESSVALGGFEASHPGLIASLPTRYIAVSETVARELREHYHVPAASLAIVPPPLNSPGEGLPPRKTERAPLVVGGMGAPGWTKGVDLWLLAARRVLGLLGEQEVRFRWIGIRDDEEGRRFRAMADKLGLLQFVDFVPETDDPLAELAAIDILAMASWEEAASLVVIEAMAIGTPVVCFRGSGGPPEEIGGAGVVVDSFCPEDMADAIADLAHRPEERTRLAGEARSRADAQYGPANIMPRLVRELLTAIDAPSRSAR